MPEGVGYGPQFTASVGKSLNIIGNHAYAYSGSIGLPQNTDTTMVEFTTGKYYLKAAIAVQGDFNTMGSTATTLKINLNGIAIVNSVTSAGNDAIAPFDYPLKLIIPPLTTVEVILAKADGGTDFLQVLLTGKVYK